MRNEAQFRTNQASLSCNSETYCYAGITSPQLASDSSTVLSCATCMRDVMMSTFKFDQPSLYTHRPIDYSKWDSLGDSDDDETSSTSHHSDEGVCTSDDPECLRSQETYGTRAKKKQREAGSFPSMRFTTATPIPKYSLPQPVVDYLRVSPLDYLNHMPNLDEQGYPRVPVEIADAATQVSSGTSTVVAPFSGNSNQVALSPATLPGSNFAVPTTAFHSTQSSSTASASPFQPSNCAPPSTPSSCPSLPFGSQLPPTSPIFTHQHLAPSPSSSPFPVPGSVPPDLTGIHDAVEQMRQLNLQWPAVESDRSSYSWASGQSSAPGASVPLVPEWLSAPEILMGVSRRPGEDRSEQVMKELLEEEEKTKQAEEEKAKQGASGKKKKKKKKGKRGQGESGDVHHGERPAVALPPATAAAATAVALVLAPVSKAAPVGQAPTVGPAPAASSSGIAAGSGKGKQPAAGSVQQQVQVQQQQQQWTVNNGKGAERKAAGSGNESEETEEDGLVLSTPNNAFALLAVVDNDEDAADIVPAAQQLLVRSRSGSRCSRSPGGHSLPSRGSPGSSGVAGEQGAAPGLGGQGRGNTSPAAGTSTSVQGQEKNTSAPPQHRLGKVMRPTYKGRGVPGITPPSSTTLVYDPIAAIQPTMYPPATNQFSSSSSTPQLSPATSYPGATAPLTVPAPSPLMPAAIPLAAGSPCGPHPSGSASPFSHSASAPPSGPRGTTPHAPTLRRPVSVPHSPGPCAPAPGPAAAHPLPAAVPPTHCKVSAYNPVISARQPGTRASSSVQVDTQAEAGQGLGTGAGLGTGHTGTGQTGTYLPRSAPRSYHQVYAQYLQQQGRSGSGYNPLQQQLAAGMPMPTPAATSTPASTPSPVPTPAHRVTVHPASVLHSAPQPHKFVPGRGVSPLHVPEHIPHTSIATSPTRHFPSSSAITFPAGHAPPSPYPHYTADYDHLVQDMDDEHLCVVCMEEHRNVLLIPCGHAMLCMACCTEIRKKSDAPSCPICRMGIEDTVVI